MKQAMHRSNGGVSAKTASPVVSVVLELDTRAVTGHISIDESVSAQLNQQGFEENEVEYIVVGPRAIDTSGWMNKVVAISVPAGDGKGYYEYKNVGALNARGKYIAFWDSDCRPTSDYLAYAVQLLEDSPELSGVGGVTFYDGSTWLTTMNTILSFGYLHRYQVRQELEAKDAILSHNVVIRKDAFPERPFGDYTARMEGDTYLSEYARQQGAPLHIDPHLKIQHEDPTFSLRGLLERHLRDVFCALPEKVPLTQRQLFLYAFWKALVSPKERLGILRQYAPYLGWTRRKANAAMPILMLYGVIDACAIAVMLFKPSLLRKWLEYQFGGNTQTARRMLDDMDPGRSDSH